MNTQVMPDKRVKLPARAQAAYSRGVYTRYGGDFSVFSVGYQYGWGT